MAAWMIMYENEKRTKLTYTQVGEFEKADYDLASEKEFETYQECEEYMKELAEKHNLRYSGDKAYLD